MPLTSAERQHRYRERLKRDAERWEAFIENDRKRRAEKKLLQSVYQDTEWYDEDEQAMQRYFERKRAAAMSSAERQHRYRERMRRDIKRWEAFMEHDRKRRAERRQAELENCSPVKRRYRRATGMLEGVNIKREKDDTELQFVCPECNRCFKNEAWLKRHFQRLHDSSVPQFACDICGKVLASSNGFSAHQRMHTTDDPKDDPDQKPYRCYVCIRRFSKPDDLRRHVMAHDNENSAENITRKTAKNVSGSQQRRELCTICGVKFIGLKRHMLMHERKYYTQCEICGWLCSTHGGLMKHRLTHGEPLYEDDDIDDQPSLAFDPNTDVIYIAQPVAFVDGLTVADSCDDPIISLFMDCKNDDGDDREQES